MWGRQCFVILLMYALYLGMVVLGSYSYRWTPLCLIYPLFGSKSRVSTFVHKKFWGRRKLDSAADESPKNWTANFAAAYLSYDLNIWMCVKFVLSHALAFYAVYKLLFTGVDTRRGLVAPAIDSSSSPVKAETLYFAVALWPLTLFGITAGAHRLWAHRSYKAHWSVRTVLMLLNSIANQGTIYHWSRDHRTHHRHSDTIADPHDSTRGFFFSHMGWLLLKKSPTVTEARRKIDMSDLEDDPIVMFQQRIHSSWSNIWCFFLPAYLCMVMWNETFWNGFLYAGVARYVFVLHCTFCVNSAAHFFGESTYDPSQPPAESAIVSFLTMGEGWHSWHHAFAFDYATSELGCLEQFNLTKFVIDCCANLGLVVDRKRGHRMWAEKKEKLKALYNCDVVESLTGPPLFRSRRITLVPRDGAPPFKLEYLRQLIKQDSLSQ